MKPGLPCLLALLAAALVTAGEPPAFLRPEVARALAAEVSGESAKRNLESLVVHHRMRGSRGFRAAAEHIERQLRAYGLPRVEWESLPADGTIFYGTQRSRPAWDAEFAELWELDAAGRPLQRIGDWQAMPLSLAQDSESADVTAELIDVGEGTRAPTTKARTYAAGSCWPRRSRRPWRPRPCTRVVRPGS